MKKKIFLNVLLLVVLISVLNMVSSSDGALESLMVLASLVSFGYLMWRLNRSPDRTEKTKKTPAKKKEHDKYTYVIKVAEDLRETARRYEDPLVEVFFALGGIQIRRATKSQDFLANAIVQFGRTGFVIDYINVNSRTGKQRQIAKAWKDTIGVTAERYELYFKDHSFIEFVPRDLGSFLYLSVFWQVFNDGLNGSQEIFQNPVQSGLGHRLREVANYLIENRATIGPKASIDVSSVPSRLKDEEFFGYSDLRFPEIRDKIKRWRLLEKLGGGAFGQVFKVEHVDTGETGAIKLMSPLGPDGKKLATDGVQFRASRELFLDEAALSLKVSSPFVVSAIDWGKEPWPWIRYPLIEGTNVREAIAKSNDPRAAWWNLAHDLISGLSTIHAEGIVHKDVKLDNILAEANRFVLLDLGIGEVVDYAEFGPFGGVGGTFGYMAPELIGRKAGSKPPGYEIDIFSAGIALLSVFDSKPMRELQVAQNSAHRSGNRAELDALLASPIQLGGAPRETHALLSAMLDLDPAGRPKAARLLNYVADFVDLEEKIELIQQYRDERMERTPPDDQRDEVRKVEEVEGSHQSWKRIEDEIYRMLDEVRPRYFIITLNGDSEDHMVYVQAMSGGGGWHVEAMSESFSKLPQSKEVKSNFMRLNWTPPSSSEPNYSIDLDNPPHPEVVRILIDAFEFGYGLKPTDIRSVEVIHQGEGKY